MDVRNAGHDDEGEIVEEPAYYGIDTSIVNFVYFPYVEVLVAALPTYKIPYKNSPKYDQGGGGAPVYHRISEKEVFCYLAVPTAHAKTNMQNGPLPPF